MPQQVFICESGCSNSASLLALFRRLGCEPSITADPDVVRRERFVVVPGVGDFASARRALDPVWAAIVDRMKEDLPTLAVCIGLQLLAETSEEAEGTGFGLVPTRCKKFPATVTVPQQGWNLVHGGSSRFCPDSGYAYFSNSYYIPEAPAGWDASICEHGVPFCALLSRGRLLACQFHPEISGSFGAGILRKWLDQDAAPAPPAQIAAPKASSRLAKRVIACLDVDQGRVVKGTKFQNLRDSGDPAELAALYESQGVDELVILDITATVEKRANALETVRRVRAKFQLPLTVGGGVRSVADAKALLAAGADKVAVNSAAVARPELLSELRAEVGQQCVVLAIDAALRNGRFEVLVGGGRKETGLEAAAWAAEGRRLGAGEILLTSWDRDGTGEGYDLPVTKAVVQAVGGPTGIPVIASGGAKCAEHLAEALDAGAQACLAASIFHDKVVSIPALKWQLHDAGWAVRVPAKREEAAPAPRFGKQYRRSQSVVPFFDAAQGDAEQWVRDHRVLGELCVRGPCDALKPLCKLATLRCECLPQDALALLDAGAKLCVVDSASGPAPPERLLLAVDASSAAQVLPAHPDVAGFVLRLDAEQRRQLCARDPKLEQVVAEAQKRCCETKQLLVVETAPPAAEEFLPDAASLVQALDAGSVEAQVCAPATTLVDLFAAPLVTERTDGLWTTVVTSESGEALGLCYSSLVSLRHAIENHVGTYWSRKRGLWVKGATSGCTQELVSVAADCDRDALRFVVKQTGTGFCHHPTTTCWGAPVDEFRTLEATINQRLEDAPAGSYTKRLVTEPGLLRAKLVEEAGELADAENVQHVAEEVADVLYFAFVRMAQRGATLEDVASVLRQRSMKVTRRKGDAKVPLPQANGVANGVASGAASGAVETASPQSFAPAPRGGERVPLQRKGPDDPDWARSGCAVRGKVLEQAGAIVDAVREGGEAAAVEYGKKFGEVQSADELFYTPQDMEAAYNAQPKETQQLLQRTAERIRGFAQAQKDSLGNCTRKIDAGKAGHNVKPVERAGCYAPGGRYPLPSTVLMTAVTARVAGCKEVLVSSPKPSPIILAAAHVAKADRVLRLGGAHAIAAMAHGAGRIPRVDVIVGPGNAYVTAAKQLCSGIVRIDMLAGPSELLVLCDHSADPGIVAADLLAQAEHDDDATPILVTFGPQGEQVVQRVEEELCTQLATLPTAATARNAIQRQGKAVVVGTLDEACAFTNKWAPEHLEIMVEDLKSAQKQLVNYGGLFVGTNAAEVFGDYGVGPNHTLPTSGTASAIGGLSVFNFLAVRTWLDMAPGPQFGEVVDDTEQLALLEGLHGHARAARRRKPAA